MNKSTTVLIITTGLAALTFMGCMMSKTTNVTTGGLGTNGVPFGPVTNVVITVNQANLTLDCGVIQGIAASAVSIVAQKDPNSVPVLKDIELALGGILNGADTNTTAQAIALLGKNNNPVLAIEMTSLINTMSALEQQLLAKYGQKVGGQIALAISQAVYGGFVIGLAGK